MKRGTVCQDWPACCNLDDRSILVACTLRQDILEESGELEALSKSLEVVRPLLRDAQAAVLFPQLEKKLGVGAEERWMLQGELAIMFSRHSK